MIRRSALILIIACVVAPAGAVAASSGAKTVAPTAAQRAGILKAFGDPQRAWPCLTVRIAAANHNYANVRFKTDTRCSGWAWDGVNVIEHVQQNQWRIRFEGSSYTCPLPHIPQPVQRDLGVCPYGA